MLAEISDAVWMGAAVGAVAVLIYGGWLVWCFQRDASHSSQQTVARLALHDWLGPNARIDEVKINTLAAELPDVIRVAGESVPLMGEPRIIAKRLDLPYASEPISAALMEASDAERVIERQQKAEL